MLYIAEYIINALVICTIITIATNDILNDVVLVFNFYFSFLLLLFLINRLKVRNYYKIIGKTKKKKNMFYKELCPMLEGGGGCGW